MKKIFIAGGSGLLGLSSSIYLSKKLDVFSSYFKNSSYPVYNNININLLEFDKLYEEIARLNPDLIFNCAGLTNIEECEKNSKKTKISNIDIPVNLSKISKILKKKFIHISTDHLFDDSKQVYTEEDIPNPLNNYGKSKYLSEIKVLKENKESLVIRSNFICSSTQNKVSFIDSIISNLKKKNKINLFHDVYFTPVTFNFLLETIFLLIQKNSKGIYNISCNEILSKYDFGNLICDLLNLNKNYLSKISKDDLDLTKRPCYMSLSNSKITKELNIKIPNIKDQINFFIKNYNYKI